MLERIKRLEVGGPRRVFVDALDAIYRVDFHRPVARRIGHDVVFGSRFGSVAGVGWLSKQIYSRATT